MELHTERLKLLWQKRAWGGLVLWALALLWGALGDWQNIEWLANHHLLPKASVLMIHPNYPTVILFVAGLAWLTVALVWPKRAGIVGSADVMIEELDIPALEYGNGGYIRDWVLFARAQVASLDTTRTITGFEMEMVAPDETVYRANSEYAVGNYDYKYEVSEKNEFGGVTWRTVREPMEDLAAKVRVPIQANTHVPRAWVRFQLKGVKQGHDPKNCQIKIFAIDPSGNRHEIATNGVQVKAIGDRECAVVRKQGRI